MYECLVEIYREMQTQRADQSVLTAKVIVEHVLHYPGSTLAVKGKLFGSGVFRASRGPSSQYLRCPS